MIHSTLEALFQRLVNGYPLTKRPILEENKHIILQHVFANRGLKKQRSFSQTDLEKIQAELQTIVYCVGNRLTDCFPGGVQFDSPLTAHLHARNWIKHLVLGIPLSDRDATLLNSKLINKRVVEAFFKNKDTELLSAFRTELRFALLHFARPAFSTSGLLATDNDKQLNCFIHNVLGLYPFFEPENDEEMVIPYKVNSQWEPVTYRFQRIDISPQTGAMAKLLLEDKDRIYAYALTPLSHPTVSPYLLFSGTVLKTGQGAVLSHLSNITPQQAAGESHDMTLVKAWLDNQTVKVITAGLSQGGVLAMLTAGRFPRLIKAAHCLNPTALPKLTLTRLLPNWVAIDEQDRPDVIIYSQLNDPIFNFETSYLPGHKTRLYRVIPDKKSITTHSNLRGVFIRENVFKKIAAFVQAHAHIYSGHHQVIILTIFSH